MKIAFKEIFKSETLGFQNGEYSRNFKRSEQPFEVTTEEWPILQRTGYFEPVKETPPQQEEQSQSDGGQQDAGAQTRAGKRAQAKN